ncbi:MAG: type II toxin-antitoxin system RelE/ParE family toxin [Anaerolineae bacterium]|nr:type II toxin-antitoxin system RelE/ParE family toxin [Anaerolineae bacterium]
MPRYRIIVGSRAAREIKRLPVEYFRQIKVHIDALGDDPRPNGATKLKGDAGYRLRVGVYRVLYDIDDQSQVVTIYRVRHRQDVYRNI